MKDHKIQKKIIDFLESEIASAVFFIIVGFFLILFPVQTVNVFCRIVFGILLVFAGLYNIGMYLSDRVQTTVFNMFAGVIVLVLGWFLFRNPQIVVNLIPGFLGALVLVDSVWMVRTAYLFHKKDISIWNIFLITAIVSIVLGVLIMINPFAKVRHTILFCGIVMLVNGAADVIFYMLRKKSLPEPAVGYNGVQPDGMNAAQNAPVTDLSVENTYQNAAGTTDKVETKKGFFRKFIGGEGKGLLDGLKKKKGDNLVEEKHFGDPISDNNTSAGSAYGNGFSGSSFGTGSSGSSFGTGSSGSSFGAGSTGNPFGTGSSGTASGNMGTPENTPVNPNNSVTSDNPEDEVLEEWKD